MQINFSNIWENLKNADREISAIVDSYKKLKSDRLRHTLPGRRSAFQTATEFKFAFGSLQAITKPLVLATDGIYCVSRISCEIYYEFVSNGFVVRQTMTPVANGLIYKTLLGDSAVGGYTLQPKPVFDFEWDYQVGSSTRHYGTDSLGGSRNLSRESLMGNNYKQFEFLRSYFFKGNDSIVLTIQPTVQLPLVANRYFIVSIVTFGHKILGYSGLPNENQG